MTKNEPLVSIGLPTYNRAATCRRAIESVLAQEYSNLEIIISDNASTDETEAMCREFAQRDDRIRYIRQETNQGAARNFEVVLEEATGEYFMWLGDDDWIDHTFVSHCVRHLETDPDFCIVTGKTIFHAFDGSSQHPGEIIDYIQSSPRKRVISYYETVGMNESFYGVIRRSNAIQIQSALKKIVVGGDWLVCAALIFLGKAKTIESTTIHRTGGGHSENIESLAKSLGAHPFQGKYFLLSISWFAFQDIVAGSRVYRSLPVVSRWLFGAQVFLAMLHRHFFLHKILPKIVRVLQIITPRRAYEKLRNWHRNNRKATD